MALFCPTCHNLLILREDPELRFSCQTCPYVMVVYERVTKKISLKPKPVAEAIGKEDEYRGPKEQAICPHCGHNEAWCHQVQIRSGDEPMTSFFRCCKCELRWREG